MLKTILLITLLSGGCTLGMIFMIHLIKQVLKEESDETFIDDWNELHQEWVQPLKSEEQKDDSQNIMF